MHFPRQDEPTIVSGFSHTSSCNFRLKSAPLNRIAVDLLVKVIINKVIVIIVIVDTID